VVDWPELEKLIRRHDATGVALAAAGLGPEQRRALVEPLRQYERQVRADPLRWRERQVLAVAGAAVLPGASALAPWLARNDASSWDRSTGPTDATPVIMEVLRDRGVPWLADLTVRLADRLPRNGRDVRLWSLVSSLVAVTGIEPPLAEGYVTHWANDRWWEGERVAEDIRRDPRLAALVPRFFEIDAVAALFSGHPDTDWPSALTSLAAEGLVDRAMLIDCCLAGLQRSGRLSALRGLLAVHDALALDLAETAAHVRDYLPLLPAAHSTVAAAAQRQLRRLDEAGKLDPAALREASEAVLLRPEKTLVRSQLDWLGKAAVRDPERAAELTLAAAAAFSHDAADLQARALAVVLKHCDALDPAATAALAVAAAALPPDLRARAAAALGPVQSASETSALVPVPVPVLAAPAAAAMPPPVGSAEELAAEISALYAAIPDGHDPVSLERVLAGLVSCGAAGQAALAAALQPVLARYGWIQPGRPRLRAEEHQVIYGPLDLIVGAAVCPPEGPANGRLPAYPEYGGRDRLPGPYAGLMARMYEIAVGVCYAPRPLLVSAPSTMTGLIEPGELLSRLQRAAAEGWEPWPLDLGQALLRLPRDPDPATAARAAGLGTPAGTALARRLTAGAADPEVTVAPRSALLMRLPQSPGVIVNRLTAAQAAAVQEHQGGRRVTIADEDVILATVRSSSPEPGRAGDPCELAGDLPEPELWLEGARFYDNQMRGYAAGWMSCWPMMLPAHRDVIAAHMVPLLLKRVGEGRGGGGVLPALARADGPVGAGMHLALAYGLGARDQGDRTAAADALVILAARGQLDGEALGRQLGFLVARGTVSLTRVLPGLREVARAGALAPVWPLVAAMLPQILPPAVSQPPQRAAELIALGVEAAQAIRPAATLPCLAALAAGQGSSQLAVQARRLRDALAAAQR